ncbi:MAG: CBS domain-containing protein [Planctomycetota bacterium]
MNADQALPTAAEVMQRDVTSFRPDQDVAEALQTLLQRRISGGPVVADRRLVGMFSERDGLQFLAASTYESEPSGTVSQHMRTEFRTVAADADLFALAELFQNNPVRRLPVVDGEGRLLGLVLRSDVIRALHALVDRRTPRRTAARTPYERIAEILAD